MLILNRDEVAAALDPAALLEAVSAGLQALSVGGVEAVPRQAISGDGGSVLMMGGREADGPVAVKLVGVFGGNDHSRHRPRPGSAGPTDQRPDRHAAPGAALPRA